ncbi:MAG: helix-turn-helix domain containing protein [Lachnospiraceae bacterium]|nr:helix-turn-helix domain containing protein [Lachnospiraceae bacterium]
MNVRNCRRCKRLFNYIVGPYYCPSCRAELEEEFQVVKKYVQDHNRADIRTVAEECNVDPSQIRQWVREERLVFSDDSLVGLNCEKCGKMIKSGRFCDECKKEMANTFSNAMNSVRHSPSNNAPASKDKTSPKMRFLDN